MLRPLLLTSALLLLAAAPASPVRPGKWEITVHPAAIQIPPQLEAESGPALRAMMTRPETTRVCLQRADLARLTPLFAPAAAQRKSCAPTALTLADGKLDGTAECKESAQPMTATITGRYTPTSFEATITRTTGGLDRAGTVAMTIDARRLGGC